MDQCGAMAQIGSRAGRGIVSRRALLSAMGVAGLAACSSSARRAVPDQIPTTGAAAVPHSPDATSPAARSLGPATEVDRGPRDSRRVALTFHVAGDPVLVRTVLDVARDR